MALRVVARTGGSKWLSALPTGSNRLSATPTHNPQGNLRIRRIREVQSMLPEFVDRTRGSQCVQAQPGRQCRQEICGEARRFEEISRSDEWRLISCSIWRQQVRPGSAWPAGSYRLYTDLSEGLTAYGGEGIL